MCGKCAEPNNTLNISASAHDALGTPGRDNTKHLLSAVETQDAEAMVVRPV